jgi:4,5-DOPA dioxygenase extradiol
MNPLPTLFISHGAPDLPIRHGAATEFLRSLVTDLPGLIGQPVPSPQAILVITAHWQTVQPMASATPAPRTIYDFSGFPGALYQMTYPAPGDPALADRVIQLLQAADFAAGVDRARGLDHGTWVPLSLMYPDAIIPVVQLSIQFDRDPHYHYRLGQALTSLREAGVLIIGSGSLTHNLGAMQSDYDVVPSPAVQEFDRWIDDAIAQQNWQDLLNYRHLAPQAAFNHPTEEHLLPLFVALGAAGTAPQGIRLHSSYTYGALSMTHYAFC